MRIASMNHQNDVKNCDAQIAVDGGGPTGTTTGINQPAPKRRSWFLVVMVVLWCWFALITGILSFLIIPLLLFGIVRAICEKWWDGLALIVVLNPLLVFATFGIANYVGGAPTLLFRGLPEIESFNVDRATRCFRSGGGGCIPMGNEWATQGMHNLGVVMMATVFGPPARSYDGPYPTKEKAAILSADAAVTANEEFLKGHIHLGEQTIELGKPAVEKLVKGLRIESLMFPEFKREPAEVRAALYEDRCLIVKISQRDDFEPDKINNEVLIFFDKKSMRPFAYFNLTGHVPTRSHPLAYLPERDR